MFAYGPGANAARLRKEALGACPCGESALELGRRAWLERRDARTARRWIRRAANLDEDDAPFYDAWLTLRSGRREEAVDPDLSEGFALAMAERGGFFESEVSAVPFERAAKRGDPLAQACCGYVLYCEDEQPRAAARWLRRAAPKVPWAALVLSIPDARMGVSRGEANRWCRVAAEAGLARAQNFWGETLRDGPESGVRRDLRAAVTWFRRAAEQGHPTAQLSLGVMLHEGRGVRRDDRECVRWYRRAARMGNAAAMANLGRCYRGGHGVRRDVRASIRWFSRSAALANERAGGDLARTYFEGIGVRQNPRLALRWARPFVASFEREAASAGGRAAGIADVPSFKGLSSMRREPLGEAYHVIGACAEDGKGMRRDAAASFRAYRAAAAAGHRCATYDLGRAYQDGRGVAKDLRQARIWHRRAATLGDTRAKARLKALGTIRRR